MDEVITVADYFDSATGRRVLHLMSNAEIVYPLPDGVQAQTTIEAGVHHLRAEVPIRGPVNIQCEGWGMPKRFVLWSLSHGERMSEIIIKAADEYFRLYGNLPRYAFVRSLPGGIEPGRAIPFMGDEVLLFAAEWMVARAVAVGFPDE